VTGPVDGESECNETVQGPDGYLDLTLKFKNQELISSLGEVSDGDELILTIVGNLMDDQEIEGNDCVIIIDNTKSEEISSTDLPTIFALEQNYPNPFYSTSVINFSIPEDCHVELQFMDMTGKIIYTIENRKYEAGYHSVVIDAMDLEQGLYFYRIVAGEYTDTKQALIIK
jgi:hypothetical protein